MNHSNPAVDTRFNKFLESLSFFMHGLAWFCAGVAVGIQNQTWLFVMAATFVLYNVINQHLEKTHA